MDNSGKTAAAAVPASASGFAAVQQTSWGSKKAGEPVQLFTLASTKLVVRVTNFGARVVSIEAPDRNGNMANIVLGSSDLAGYEADVNTYMGSVVGRYANRIANGTFTLNGQSFHVPKNNGQNALHGGTTGFDRKVWEARAIPGGVELTLVSPDGEMGFPGVLTARVHYTLVGDALHIDYSATSDKATVVNLANHTYFNLSGEGRGNILGQKLMLNADRYTPVNENLIPTGELLPVEGTPLDFRQPFVIGARIDETNEQLQLARGYDHNFVINGGPAMQLAARVLDPETGRTLTVTTTEPGVQFYTGNFLDGSMIGASGIAYGMRSGFCLETQHFPDSPNQKNFPSTELIPGQTMHSSTVFTFGGEK